MRALLFTELSNLSMLGQHQRIDPAFTLVELLVVIAIMGVLAALLLPAISQSQKRAQRIQCVNNLHQLGVGLQVILADEHAYPLFVSGRYSSWIDQLEEQGLGVSHPRTTNGAFEPKTDFYEKGVWCCPAAHYPVHNWLAGELGSYSYNGYGVYPLEVNTNALGLFGHFDSISGKSAPIKESEVVSPSDMMALGDSFDGSMTFRRNLNGLDRYGNLMRHQGKANAVFCDGHVESPTLKFLFEDTSDAALVRWNRDHLPHREKLSP